MPEEEREQLRSMADDGVISHVAVDLLVRLHDALTADDHHPRLKVSKNGRAPMGFELHFGRVATASGGDR